MAAESKPVLGKTPKATRNQHKCSWGKRRNRQSKIAEAAVHYVQSLFNQMNWSSNRIAEEDSGEDLLVKIFDEKTCVSTNTQFLVQVKGSTRLRRIRNHVVYDLKTRDIVAWLGTNLPVLVVVCDVKHLSSIRGYCVWIDAYVCKHHGWLTAPNAFDKKRTLAVRIPSRALLRTASSAALRKYADSWSSPSEASKKILTYVEGLAQDRIELYKRRGKGGRFRSDLFALPISYDRLTASKGPLRVDGEHELLNQAGRKMCLLGKPATGKTTTVDRILARSPGSTIPVLLRNVKPRDMMEDGVNIVSQALRIGHSHADYLAENGHLLFVLDSLNECGSRWPKFSRGILSLARTFRSARFVVTCRTDDYGMMKSPLTGFERWEISPLSPSAQNDFVARQSKSRSTRETVRRAFKEQPDLRKLCTNQFMFLIAVEFIPDLRGGRLRRADLYRKLLDRYLRWLKIGGLEKNRSMEILSKVAFMMRKSPGRETTITTSAFDRLLSNELGPRSVVIDMRTQLRKLGLLVRDGRRGLRFFQETLQEYLCANYLVQQGIFPKEFGIENGLSYDGVALSNVIVSFYVELTFISRLLARQYRDIDVWV